MLSGTRRLFVLLLVGITASSGCAVTIAGIPVREVRVSEWNSVMLIRPGTRVQVGLESQGILNATFSSASDTGLDLLMASGPRHVDRKSVVSVVAVESKHDGVMRGVIFGAILGTTFAAISCGSGAGSSSDCAKAWLLLPAFLAGTGATVAALGHKEVVVYERQPSGTVEPWPGVIAS